MILDDSGNPLPVIEMIYRPPVQNAGSELVDVKVLESFPSNVVSSSGYTGFRYVQNNQQNYRAEFFIFDPFKDWIYYPGQGVTTNTRRIGDDFVNSWAYKSFYFTRNNVSDIVGTDTLQSKIINSLKVWVLIALGLGVAFLVVRFGPQIMIRLFLPFAVLGALGRIGRSNKDE